MNFDYLELAANKLPLPVIKLLRSSFVLYVIGGCIAASVHLLVVAFAVEIISLSPENANSIGFIIGVAINYSYQRSITFRKTARKHVEQLPLFVGFAFIGLGVNRYAYAHGMDDLNMDYLVAAAFSILVVFVFNFVANTLVTFGPRRK